MVENIILQPNMKLDRDSLEELRSLSYDVKNAEKIKNEGELAETRRAVLLLSDPDGLDFARENNLPVIAWERDGGPKISGVKYVITSLDALDCPFVEKVYARHFGIPLEILRTERTIVRELALSDLTDLFHIYEDSRMTEFMEDLFPYEEELEYERNYIEKIYGFYEFGLWGVYDIRTNRLIGRAGVEAKEDLPLDTVELSYQLTPELWGQGIMKEVLAAILAYTEESLGMERVVARVDAGNERSIGLLMSLSFEEFSKKSDGVRYFQEKDEKDGLLTYCKEFRKSL